MFFKTGKSSKEVGFLSPEMEPFVAQCRKQNALWFALAEDINRTAQATLTTYQIGPEISAQSAERKMSRPGGISRNHTGMAVLFDDKRLRPPLFNRIAQAVE